MWQWSSNRKYKINWQSAWQPRDCRPMLFRGWQRCELIRGIIKSIFYYNVFRNIFSQTLKEMQCVNILAHRTDLLGNRHRDYSSSWQFWSYRTLTIEKSFHPHPASWNLLEAGGHVLVNCLTARDSDEGRVSNCERPADRSASAFTARRTGTSVSPSVRTFHISHHLNCAYLYFWTEHFGSCYSNTTRSEMFCSKT
jgi:hypothetical protein